MMQLLVRRFDNILFIVSVSVSKNQSIFQTFNENCYEILYNIYKMQIVKYKEQLKDIKGHL